MWSTPRGIGGQAFSVAAVRCAGGVALGADQSSALTGKPSAFHACAQSRPLPLAAYRA